MKITYDSKYDVLYIGFAESKRKVMNKNLSEDITVDLDKNNMIVGMEFLDASEHIELDKLLPVKVNSKSLLKTA